MCISNPSTLSLSCHWISRPNGRTDVNRMRRCGSLLVDTNGTGVPYLTPEFRSCVKLSVLMSIMFSVDVKQHWTMHTHWSQFVPNMSTRHPRTLSSISSSPTWLKNSKPLGPIVYADGPVTKDQSWWGFSIKQGVTTIHKFVLPSL